MPTDTAAAKQSSHKMQPIAVKVDPDPIKQSPTKSATLSKVDRDSAKLCPTKSATISSASASTRTSANIGAKTESTCAANVIGGANTRNSKIHSFIKLNDCSSESNNCDQMLIQLKTLPKIAE